MICPSRVRLIFFFFIFQATNAWTQSPLPDFDVRDARPAAADLIVESRKVRLAAFVTSPEQAQLRTRIVPNRYGLPKLYLRESGVLSAPSDIKPSEVAKSFLRTHSEIFWISGAEIDRLRLAVEDVSGNASFLAFNQTLNGIDVFNGHIKVTLNKDREVVQVATGDVVAGLNISTTPRLGSTEAITAAFAALGVDPLTRRGPGLRPVTTELTIFPMTASMARLAYRVFLEVNSEAWYELVVDADSGALLFRHNLYVNAAEARVWKESPARGPRSLVTFLNEWLSDGTVTTGNNVDAFVDGNANGQPDEISGVNMKDGRAHSPGQSFDFDAGDGVIQVDPRLFSAASLTNLFYFVNVAHDYFYSLGFGESAGNFQKDNFGRGGTGNDAVLASAQLEGFSNASFAPTPDGMSPRLRMGLFTRGTASRTDDLDSSYDGSVVMHEYAHGVSTRLVGAKTSTSCLIRIQSGALGEGWSDYFAISFFSNPAVGAHLTQNGGRGFRRYSYEGYPLTYEDIGTGPLGYEPHSDGEIWAATLWDVRKTIGAPADQLVIDGLKATPCNPSMTDARDAIITADQATNGGAKRAALWTVFARHGLGYSAAGDDGAGSIGTRYDAAYDLPPDLQARRNPAITSNPLLLRVSSGHLFTYTVAVSNPDGGTLAYALSSGPADMRVDASTGTVTWQAAFASPRVKITITDSRGGKVVHGFSVPVMTPLINAVPLTLEAGAWTRGYASFNVPEGVPVLQVKLRGGYGDPDLLVVSPTGVFGISGRVGSTESLSFPNPSPGEWQVQVLGATRYGEVRLTAVTVTPKDVDSDIRLTSLGGEWTDEDYYRISLRGGLPSFSISATGGAGNAAIFLRRGSPAACQPFEEVLAPCLYDFSAANTGSTTAITVQNPAAGDWYLVIVGRSSYHSLTLDISTQQPLLSWTGDGAATTSTAGTAPTTATGYAIARVSEGTAPYGIAVFRLSQHGVVVNEVGIPATHPTPVARVFVEHRTGVPSGSGRLDIFTGVAVVNTTGSPSNVYYILRDRNGETISVGWAILPPYGHFAKLVHELKDVAPNFNYPENFASNSQFGTLEINGQQPMSVLGLRLTRNQRGETLMTSTVIHDEYRRRSGPVWFPHFVDGGGYTTTLVFMGGGAGTISFLDDNGNPMTVRPVGGTPASSFTYSVPTIGTYVFQTDGSSASTRTGWIYVTGPQTAVSGILSYSRGGILVSESGVPAQGYTTRARIFVDKSKGHDTGVALGNPNEIPVNVTLQAYDIDGNTRGAATMRVAAYGHSSAYVGQVIAGLPDGFVGVVDLSASTAFVPLTLRTLVNGRGDFLLTTFPAANISEPAPTPIVFPQIADGAGYSTEFIFIGAGKSGTVSLDFRRDDGSPLNINR